MRSYSVSLTWVSLIGPRTSSDSSTGSIVAAGELLSVLDTMKIRDLTEDDCADLVRDFDGSGDGKIELAEFAAILSCKEPPQHCVGGQPQEAHLELHFDINKTVSGHGGITDSVSLQFSLIFL